MVQNAYAMYFSVTIHPVPKKTQIVPKQTSVFKCASIGWDTVHWMRYIWIAFVLIFREFMVQNGWTMVMILHLYVYVCASKQFNKSMVTEKYIAYAFWNMFVLLIFCKVVFLQKSTNQPWFIFAKTYLYCIKSSIGSLFQAPRCVLDQTKYW